MIRSLPQPLLKEWTLAGGRKQLPSSTRSFSTCRYSKANLNGNALFLEYRIGSAKPSHAPRSWYSTVPDQPDVKNKAEVPPPVVPASSKPKIDLRPAPKKVTKGTVAPSNPPATTTKKIASSPAGSSSSASAAPTVEPVIPVPDPKLTTQGSIEATKYDLSEARRVGILAPPPKEAGQIGVIWHNLKQIFWFYYGGVKTIFVTNRKAAAAIEQRIKEAKARGEEVSLTRRESRFIKAHRQDLLRLLPFIITVLLLEEAIPVIVLYAPALLPTTCLLPTQVDRIRAKRRTKQLNNLELAKSFLQSDDAKTVGAKELKGLNSSLTTAVTGILGQATFFPTFIQQWRLRRFFARVAADDAIISKEDMGARLNASELVQALEERGLVSQGSQTHSHHLQKLQWWLKGATDANARLALILQYAKEFPSSH